MPTSQTSRDPDRWLEAVGAPRLRYRDEGRGPVVVLVHGWLLDLTMFDALAAALAPSFRVLRWDRRGFGASAGVPDLAADVDDALRLLQHLGVDRCGVLGMSQGARVALGIVGAAPARATCVVLDGVPPLESLPGEWVAETPVHEYRNLLVERGLEALRAELARHPLFRLQTRDPDAHARLAAALARYDGADLAATVGPGRVATAPLERLTLPVRVLNGDRDTSQRLRIGATLAATIPHADLRLVRDAGHLACWDQPAAYAACVREFFEFHCNDGPQAPGAP